MQGLKTSLKYEGDNEAMASWADPMRGPWDMGAEWVWYTGAQITVLITWQGHVVPSCMPFHASAGPCHVMRDRLAMT